MFGALFFPLHELLFHFLVGKIEKESVKARWIRLATDCLDRNFPIIQIAWGQ